MREDVRSEWHAVRIVIVRQEFVFQFGHVYVGWAFRLAAFALQAKVQRIMQRLARKFVGGSLSGNDLAQIIAAASG